MSTCAPTAPVVTQSRPPPIACRASPPRASGGNRETVLDPPLSLATSARSGRTERARPRGVDDEEVRHFGSAESGPGRIGPPAYNVKPRAESRIRLLHGFHGFVRERGDRAEIQNDRPLGSYRAVEASGELLGRRRIHRARQGEHQHPTDRVDHQAWFARCDLVPRHPGAAYPGPQPMTRTSAPAPRRSVVASRARLRSIAPRLSWVSKSGSARPYGAVRPEGVLLRRVAVATGSEPNCLARATSLRPWEHDVRVCPSSRRI